MGLAEVILLNFACVALLYIVSLRYNLLKTYLPARANNPVRNKLLLSNLQQQKLVMVAYINNSFVEEELAAINVSDLSIQRGYAVFDYFRIRNYTPLFINDYLDRFYRSALGLRLTVPITKQQLKEVIAELLI